MYRAIHQVAEAGELLTKCGLDHHTRLQRLLVEVTDYGLSICCQRALLSPHPHHEQV